jgi:hypothetical protein
VKTSVAQLFGLPVQLVELGGFKSGFTGIYRWLLDLPLPESAWNTLYQMSLV